jgi:hypothetical protein
MWCLLRVPIFTVSTITAPVYKDDYCAICSTFR